MTLFFDRVKYFSLIIVPIKKALYFLHLIVSGPVWMVSTPMQHDNNTTSVSVLCLTIKRQVNVLV